MRRPEWLAGRGGARELLRVPASVFGALAAARSSLYDRGLLPVARLDAPVVSVGNLTTGGTGKTPLVAWLCRELARRGRRPGILSRGYGARSGEASDEARALARELPDVPHVSDPDRVRGAALLLGRGTCDVVVLDDGFQHRRLWRDLDLVLVDATRPWGLPARGGEPVRALLPRGLLREPARALARADLLVLTRCDQVPAAELEALAAELERLAPGRPQARAVHRPRALERLDGGEHAPLEALAGRAVDLVSGIGNPEAFEASVRALGARVASHRALPDHHAWRAADLAGLGAERWVLTTAKDAPKLLALGEGLGALEPVVLAVELELASGAGVACALLDALPRGSRERERASLHEGLHG